MKKTSQFAKELKRTFGFIELKRFQIVFNVANLLCF